MHNPTNERSVALNARGHPVTMESKRTDAPSRIRVFVRCRPLGFAEGDHSCDRIQLSGNSVIVNDPQTPGEARRFTFDRVFTPDTGQSAFFDEVSPLIDHVLNGFHATMFLYGQTGSGKTFTMEGLNYVARKHAMLPDLNTPPEQHGVALRAIQVMFDAARGRQRAAEVDPAEKQHTKGGVRYVFRCSFFQLYNEVITDLLRPQSTSSRSSSRHDGGLRLRWHQGDVFRVENLFCYECDTPDKMREVYLNGTREKVIGSHLMNAQSSRSHCVFTIYVECVHARGNEVISRSELSLVDLAGSERIGLLSRDPSAKLVRESIDINTSLLTLGKVITSLASQKSRGRQAAASHIPYRDSKLTKVLKHALGGNSLTLMIACISPSDKYVEESVATLFFAGRARNIENIPHVNEDPMSALVRQLRAEIAQQKNELSHYRQLATSSITERGITAADGASQSVAPATSVDAASLDKNLPDSTAAAQSSQQANLLADSLLNACEMLKQIIGVNGQLRDAYDIVKEAKEEAEGREVQLNAENIALRERITMLESIVLHKDSQDFEAGTTEAHGPTLVNTNADEDNKPISCSNESSASVLLEHSKDDVQVGAHRELSRGHSAPHDQQEVIGCEEDAVVQDSAPTADDKSSRHEKKRRTKKKKQKKLEWFLAEYEQKYCLATQTKTYSDLYGRAQKQVPQNRRVNETIREMEVTLRKLPKSLIPYVPVSLTEPGKYGTLAFGGTDAEVKQFEVKREAREARRAALLAQQRALYSSAEDHREWTSESPAQGVAHDHSLPDETELINSRRAQHNRSRGRSKEAVDKNRSQSGARRADAPSGSPLMATVAHADPIRTQSASFFEDGITLASKRSSKHAKRSLGELKMYLNAEVSSSPPSRFR